MAPPTTSRPYRNPHLISMTNVTTLAPTRAHLSLFFTYHDFVMVQCSKNIPRTHRDTVAVHHNAGNKKPPCRRARGLLSDLLGGDGVRCRQFVHQVRDVARRHDDRTPIGLKANAGIDLIEDPAIIDGFSDPGCLFFGTNGDLLMMFQYPAYAGFCIANRGVCGQGNKMLHCSSPYVRYCTTRRGTYAPP